mmetsp:Transcript_67461/g.113018  ORF Transcript_67461/g.113018 Transcript_67461/m.113018 type:complete len:285 (-) Transcript_67461:1564-2418(-)
MHSSIASQQRPASPRSHRTLDLRPVVPSAQWSQPCESAQLTATGLQRLLHDRLRDAWGTLGHRQSLCHLRHQHQGLDADMGRQQRQDGRLVSLRRVLHFQDRQDSFNVAGHFAELRDVDNGVELRRQVRALQDVQVGRGAQDQQLLPRGGGRPQQRQDGLQQRVGEARAQMHVLDQALDVVQNDDAEGGLVRVIEDLTDQIAFRDLSVADQTCGGHDLDEGELAVQRHGRCHGGLAGALGALQQHRETVRARRGLELLNEGERVGLDAVGLGAVIEQAVARQFL